MRVIFYLICLPFFLIFYIFRLIIKLLFWPLIIMGEMFSPDAEDDTDDVDDDFMFWLYNDD